MWVFRWILALLLIIFALIVGWLNIDQMITMVTFTFWNYQIETRLFMALFVALILGTLAWFPVAIVQFISNKKEIRQLKRDNSRFQKELSDLRNISIDEDGNRDKEDE